MLRRALVIILSISFMLSTLCFGAGAVGQTVIGGDITIDTVEAYVGNSVIVSISIKNNPGIMALTVGIGYDSSVLSYDGYYYGDVFNDYTVAAHSEKNNIRLAICESRDKNNDGKILSLKFNISETAEVGTYPITLEYSKGDFANYGMDYIMPTVENGAVTVMYCDHPESHWVTVDPTFEMDGSRNLVCDVCNNTMEKNNIMKLVYGDLSRDGVLKSNDLVGLKRLLLSTLSKENYEELVADVNGDEAVDVRDLVKFKKYFVGMSNDLGKPNENTESSNQSTSSNVQSSTQSNEAISSMAPNASSEDHNSSKDNATNSECCSSTISENNYPESVSPECSSNNTTTSNP